MRSFLFLLGTVALLGCGKSTPPVGGILVPDFLLVDVNPNSATHNADVSPRGFVGRVSGWYFGAAT